MLEPDAFNVGHQTPGDLSYDDESNGRDPSWCTRCSRNRDGHSEFCTLCRSYLLGDISVDPLQQPVVDVASYGDWEYHHVAGAPPRYCREPVWVRALCDASREERASVRERVRGVAFMCDVDQDVVWEQMGHLVLSGVGLSDAVRDVLKGLDDG